MKEDPPPFALYNPAMLEPEVLLSEFTARLDILERILAIIRANKDGEPPQHVLFVGARGMGKTTLLCAISASIQVREPNLRKNWQPVLFDEESRRIGDLADFWLESIRQWENSVENHPECELVDNLLDNPGPDLEEKARETFLQLIDESGKRALLLVDNLNHVLAAIHEEEEQLRLRSFLMQDSRVMLIGGATRWFEEVTNVDKPFYEFFRPIELKPLSFEEMKDSLTKIAQVRNDENVLEILKNRQGGIAALHVLTGGNPRLIRTFYRLLNEGLAGEIRQQLERLIDDYTPYHKAIVDNLPPQQQRVYDAIALNWNPCDVATVAKATRLKSNQASAQIKALTKASLISEAPLAGTEKKKKYLLSDRFSNIHYLMRHGRSARRKMHWYVLTLRELFDDNDYVENMMNAIHLGRTKGEFFRMECKDLIRNALEAAGNETAKRLFLDKITDTQSASDPELAEIACREAIEQSPSDYYAYLCLGICLERAQNRTNEAKNAYVKATELSPDDPIAWICLGNVLATDPETYSDAEKAYRKAIRITPKLYILWRLLGSLLDRMSRDQEAEDAFKTAIQINPIDASSHTDLGAFLFKDHSRFNEAETAFRQAIKIDPNDSYAWNFLGIILSQNLKKYGEAEECFREAIQLNPNHAPFKADLAFHLLNREDAISEAQELATEAVMIDPGEKTCRAAFIKLCLQEANFLHKALPSITLWCLENPKDADQKSVYFFLFAMWINYAKIESPQHAEKLIEKQSEEVQEALEILNDAFKASVSKGYLHQLAPERIAAALKGLEKLGIKLK